MGNNIFLTTGDALIIVDVQTDFPAGGNPTVFDLLLHSTTISAYKTFPHIS